ncbi:hypothetical protein LXL04_019779 [Taraxacum kok-saghyz]
MLRGDVTPLPQRSEHVYSKGQLGPKSKKHLTKKRQLDSFSFDRDAGFNLMDFWLDVYIHDYLLKLHACANAFMTEGKVATDPIAIDVPCGFLFEWWSVFWDIFIAGLCKTL